MKKKLMIALLAVALGLALYGTASAVDINVYGASAQYNFWSSQGTLWLTSPTGGNCTGGIIAGPITFTSPANTAPFHGQKYYFATGATCGAVGGANITVRVTAADSYDGLDAVAQLPYAFDSVVPNSPNNHFLDPQGAETGTSCPVGQRTMIADGTNNPPVYSPWPGDFGCFPVTLGASDVTPDIFTQKTTFAGTHFDGPSGAAAAWGPINLTAGNLPAGMPGLTHAQPVVVPFGLWLNSSVTLQQCAAPSPIPYLGSPCTASSQCGVGGFCAGAAPVTNLPLEWVNLLFTGKITNWQELNTAFSSEPVNICIRVPGSGTLATLDYAIMKRTGGSLPVREQAGPPAVWFNFTSSDVEKCVDTENGAIGILDADDSTVKPANGGYGPVFVEGQPPTRTDIRTGLYDYFTFENLYESASCSADVTATGCNQLVQNFIDFSNLPENITASGRSLYASTAEMLVTKAGATYPAVTPGGAMGLCELTGAPLIGGENPGAICSGASPAGTILAGGCVGSTICTIEKCSVNGVNAPGLCPGN